MTTISRDILEELAWCSAGETVAGHTVVQKEYLDQGRWDTHYWMVVAAPDGKCYRTKYSIGSTEMSETRPYDYDPDQVPVEEVVAKEVTTIEWVPVG